jgi:hypothetical protein
MSSTTNSSSSVTSVYPTQEFESFKPELDSWIENSAKSLHTLLKTRASSCDSVAKLKTLKASGGIPNSIRDKRHITLPENCLTQTNKIRKIQKDAEVSILAELIDGRTVQFNNSDSSIKTFERDELNRYHKKLTEYLGSSSKTTSVDITSSGSSFDATSSHTSPETSDVFLKLLSYLTNSLKTAIAKTNFEFSKQREIEQEEEKKKEEKRKKLEDEKLDAEVNRNSSVSAIVAKANRKSEAVLKRQQDELNSKFIHLERQVKDLSSKNKKLQLIVDQSALLTSDGTSLKKSRSK